MTVITFSGAYVRHAALAISNKDGAKTARVDFTFNWTASVRKAMDWPELENGQDAADLLGGMLIQSIKFEVGDHEFDLGAGQMKSFRVLRIDDGKRKSIHLRAQYVSQANSLMGIVESYVENAARAKGNLKCVFKKLQPEDADGTDQARATIE